MALLVWGPLTQNCNNQGLAALQFAGISTSNLIDDGKLGKCYNVPTSSSFSIGSTAQLFSAGQDWTIAYWIKLLSYPSTQGDGIICSNKYKSEQTTYNGTTYTGGGFGVYILSNGNLKVFTNSASEEYAYETTVNLSLNTWYHVCVTYQNKKCSIYKDGILSDTWIAGGLWTLNGCPFYFGVGSQGGWNYRCGKNLNDVRIYNECLSAKQVKEISKGLVLHYLFNCNHYNSEHGLPDAYQEVEYIESTTGNERISFSKNIPSKANIIFDVMPLASSQHTPLTVGNMSLGPSSEGYWQWTFNGGYTYHYILQTDDIYRRLKFNISAVPGAYRYTCSYYNDITYTSTTQGSGSTPDGSNINLFTSLKERIYSLIIIDINTNACILNLIPCYRKSDQVVGMYDIISSTFYSNSGSGTFGYGALIKQLPNTYAPLNYLESTGVQYIDTGTTFGGNTVREFDINFLQFKGRDYGINANSATEVLLSWGSNGRHHYLGGGFYYDLYTNRYYHTFLSTITNSLALSLDNKVIRTSSGSASTKKDVLFACLAQGASDNTITNKANLRYKNYLIKDNGIPIRDFRPALRLSDNKPGMYDLVNDVFYINQGTETDFVYEGVDPIVYDTSGYCNNGTIINGPMLCSYISPRYDGCYNFNSTNYIRVPTSNYDVRTVSLWICFTTISNGQNIIFIDPAKRQGLGWLASNYTSRLCCSSGVSAFCRDVSDITNNTWHHFVIVSPDGYTSANRIVYIDGNLREAGSNQNNWSPNQYDYLEIGRRSTSNDGFKGKISDFRYYATALSAADVKELYETSMSIDASGNILPRVLS